MKTDGPGHVPLVESYFRSSHDDPQPWIQIEYDEAMSVVMVLLVPLYSNVYGSLQNVQIYIGNYGLLYNELSQNGVCASHSSLIPHLSFQLLKCAKIMTGKYVQVQQSSVGMSLNEIVLLTASTWSQSRFFMNLLSTYRFGDSKFALIQGNVEMTVPRNQINAFASSILSNAEDLRGPQFLADGLLSTTSARFFHSAAHDLDPWIHLFLFQSWTISRLFVRCLKN